LLEVPEHLVEEQEVKGSPVLDAESLQAQAEALLAALDGLG
jgi:hypothetical protein